jgi:nicotinate-nucleotide adenylyltransferase
MFLKLGSKYERVGIFGGSFDPPHWGHIRTARNAADELQLDQLAFLPAKQPPHKRDRELTDFDLRRQMLELCLPLDHRFRLCLIEGEENLSGATLETVRRLREQGFTADHCRLIWLMGSDSLLELGSWYHPEELLQSLEVAVLPRPGYPSENAPKKYYKQVTILHTTMIDLASQDIRAHRLALRETVPPPVAQFITKNGIYGYTDPT